MYNSARNFMLLKNMKICKTLDGIPRSGFHSEPVKFGSNLKHVSVFFIIVNHSHRTDQRIMFSEFLTNVVSHSSCPIFTRPIFRQCNTRGTALRR